MPITPTIKIKHVRVNLSGLDALVQKIDSNTLQPLQSIQTYMMGRIIRNFESQGALFQAPWAPLSLTTRLIKRELLRKGRIVSEDIPLVRTGRMVDSFRGTIYRRDKGWRLSIGNPTPYFKKHQSSKEADRRILRPSFHGGARKYASLPRRVMLRILNQDRSQIRKIIREWVDRNKPKTKRAVTSAPATPTGGWTAV